MRPSAAATQAPDPIQYLDQVAATTAARDYKQRLLASLRLGVGQTVVDVGCGPGTDLTALADTVTATGKVIGVDSNPLMVHRARLRSAGRPWIDVQVADAGALPLAGGSVDRARVDRVLMNLADPAAALAELRRVLRPGGLLAMAEPDWDTLVIDAPDIATSRAVAHHMATGLGRDGAMGRQLARLAASAGFVVRDLEVARNGGRRRAGPRPTLAALDTPRRGSATPSGTSALPPRPWTSPRHHPPFRATSYRRTRCCCATSTRPNRSWACAATSTARSKRVPSARRQPGSGCGSLPPGRSSPPSHCSRRSPKWRPARPLSRRPGLWRSWTATV